MKGVLLARHLQNSATLLSKWKENPVNHRDKPTPHMHKPFLSHGSDLSFIILLQKRNVNITHGCYSKLERLRNKELLSAMLGQRSENIGQCSAHQVMLPTMQVNN